jgi:hypothetical protein
MERREFLTLGALAGVAVAEPGCLARGASVLSSGAAPEMDAFLAELDGNMNAIAASHPLEGAIARPEGAAPYSPETRLLLQKMLRAFTMAAAYRELPEDAREHPGFATRLAAARPEMDEAVLGMTKVMAELTPAQRVEYQRALKRDPELPRRII